MTDVETDRRSEVEVAANVLHLLRVAKAIAPAANRREHLGELVGVSMKDLALAEHRAQRHGLDSLRVRDHVDTGSDPIVIPIPEAVTSDNVRSASSDEETKRSEEPCPDPSAHEPKRRSPRLGHPGEKLCDRCGEWLPVDQFGPRAPGDPRPHKMCQICLGEFERDHFVAVKKSKALHQVVAYLTATRGDPYVGRTCPRCSEPLVLGQCITLTAEPVHAKCPKMKR